MDKDLLLLRLSEGSVSGCLAHVLWQTVKAKDIIYFMAGRKKGEEWIRTMDRL